VVAPTNLDRFSSQPAPHPPFRRPQVSSTLAYPPLRHIGTSRLGYVGAAFRGRPLLGCIVSMIVSPLAESRAKCLPVCILAPRGVSQMYIKTKQMQT
jgi:hypothetical protein